MYLLDLVSILSQWGSDILLHCSAKITVGKCFFLTFFHYSYAPLSPTQ